MTPSLLPLRRGCAGHRGHQRGDGQRRHVVQPAAVEQRRGCVAERTEQHGAGAEKIRGVASHIDTEQCDHAGEADDKPRESLAVRDPGPDQPQRDAASQHVTENDIAALLPCGPDTGQYVKAVREYVQAGFTHVALVQVGAERQRDFIDWSARELLPALREL